MQHRVGAACPRADDLSLPAAVAFGDEQVAPFIRYSVDRASPAPTARLGIAAFRLRSALLFGCVMLADARLARRRKLLLNRRGKPIIAHFSAIGLPLALQDATAVLGGRGLIGPVLMELFMLNFASRLLRQDSGATAVEYGLIAALISLLIIAGATAIGNNLAAIFTNIGSSL
jgi:pilus assembly protein Flp/PilA